MGGHPPAVSPLGYREDPELRSWLAEAGQALVDALVRGTTRDDPVVRYATPRQLHEVFADGLGLPVPSGAVPADPALALDTVKDILDRAVHSAHPRFFNQNWAGADPISVIGDWMTALLNTTAATYEMAPLFTLMENELLARMAALMGLASEPDGPQLRAGAHGLFTPGGATSNLYALHLARAWRAPEAVEEGLGGRKLVAFTSEQSHYSLSKGAAMIGLGRRSLVQVPCDEAGRMRVDALARAVQQARADGGEPFFVNATCGTTVAGAFDDVEAVAELAEREGLWLHVDACYGGSVIFSRKHRHMLRGVERAHSVAWNPHKMMGIAQQCSVLLVADPALVRHAFAARANYIFQSDKNDADQDLGDLTLQCGRRADGLKLWLTWKLRGESWFEQRIDHALALAEALEEKVRRHPAFALAHPRTFANVGFWWVPSDLRPLPEGEAMSDEVAGRLHALAPVIKNAMQREGSTMLGYQPLGDRPNFFRLLVMSPDVRESDLDATLAIVDRLGQTLVMEEHGARAKAPAQT
ncbi:MAG: pyridoxal-dependent decarboxylase [Myxococcota bacterium]